MSNSRDKRLAAATILRIIARVFGGIVVIFFLVIIFGGFSQDEFSLDSLYIMIPVVIAAGAYITAWWREMLGGILLVVAYLLLALSPNIQSIILKGHLVLYTGLLIYGSPFLIAGILFIVTALFDRRYKKPVRR